MTTNSNGSGSLARRPRPLGSSHVREQAFRTLGAGTLLALVLCLAGCATAPPVDTVPPAVASHTPADGDDNVSVHQVIEVRFSEPLGAGTVSDATVQLAGTGSVSLAKTLDLSDDGVLVVTPVAALSLPQDVVLNLSAGVKDRAGNALTPFSYGWTFPSWLRLGDDPVLEYTGTTFIYSPLMVVDSQDLPVVASNRDSSPQARLSRWDGAQWQALPLPPAVDDDLFIADMAFDQQDRLVLVWDGRTEPTGHSNFFVSRLEGGTWTQLGGGLLADANHYTSAAALAIRGDGHPVVAWAEKDTPGNAATDQHVSRWDGSNWMPVGGILDVTDSNIVQDIDLVIGLSGGPIVAWSESFSGAAHVRTFDPTTVSWQSLGTMPSSFAAPQLVVPAAGGLVAAIPQTGGVRLYRFNGTNWLPEGVPLLRATGASPGKPSAALTSEDTVMVAWPEFLAQESTVNVAEATDAGWVFHGDAIGIAPGSGFTTPSLALLDGDLPALVVGTFEPLSGGSAFVSRSLYRQLNR